jgi:hypothetical protein
VYKFMIRCSSNGGPAVDVCRKLESHEVEWAINLLQQKLAPSIAKKYMEDNPQEPFCVVTFEVVRTLEPFNCFFREESCKIKEK